VKLEDNNIQKAIRDSSRSSLKTTNDPERNTMEQCIRLENDIQKSFVSKSITVGVFIDSGRKVIDHNIIQCRTNTTTLWSTILNNIYISEKVLLILTCNVLLLTNSFTYDNILPHKIKYSKI
jgi:hypothetical protein